MISKKENKESKNKQIKVKWTKEEQEKFVEALNLYGEKNVHKISNYIGTRTVIQVRSHLQKYKIKQNKSNNKNNETDTEPIRKSNIGVDKKEKSTERKQN